MHKARSYALTYASRLSILLAVVYSAIAADSPRFRGPNGDGIFPETDLLRQWPADGPVLEWTFNGLGAGYSSAAVVGNKVYVTGMDDTGQGQLFCIGIDGRLIWKTSYGPEFVRTGPAPGGTRGTPAVSGGIVAILTGLGQLVVCDANDGRVTSRIDLLAATSAKQAQFGFAECPLIMGNMIICTPGGPDATVVAVRIDPSGDGKVVWKASIPAQGHGYCSARLVQHAGRALVLTMLSNAVAAIDPTAGELVWWHHFRHQAGVQPNPPLYVKGLVYCSSGMGRGGALFELGSDPNAQPRWADRSLDCQMQGTVLLDGYIYGTAQGGNRGLVCLRLEDGNVMWNAPDIRQAVVVAADGMLYAYGQDGQVWLIRPSPERFEPISRFAVIVGTGEHWAHPTIAAGRLFIRHGDCLLTYKIKAGSS